MRELRSRCAAVVCLLHFFSCGGEVSSLPATSQSAEALKRHGAATHQPIQPGTHLLLLQVTQSGYAVYQDGTSIYATALKPGAARQFISTTSQVGPQVYTDHGVVFVWPDAPYAAPQPGRLVAWTPCTGAVQLSATSLASSLTTAASRNGTEVLFLDNLSSDGATADVVLASPDLSTRRVLAAGIDATQGGACSPLLGFGRGPIVEACAPGAGTAELKVGGRTLASGLVQPPFAMGARDGEEFVAVRASDHAPLLIDEDARITPLDTQLTGRAFFAADGTLFSSTRTATGRDLRLLEPGQPARLIADLGANTVLYSNHAAPGFPTFADEITSPHGAIVMSGVLNPNTGLTSVDLTDASQAPSPVVHLEAGHCGSSFELFTRDGAHALYYCIDPNTGLVSLRTGGLDGVTRTLSTGNASDFQHYGLKGSRLLFSDDVVANDPLWLNWQTALKVTDAARKDAPTTVVTSAYANFFVTPERDAVVFTSDVESGGAGLYVRSVR